MIENNKKQKSKDLAARPLGLRIHREPCGNVACARCYVREARFRDGQLYMGVYPKHGQATYPGKVIGGERFRNEEAAEAAGVRWHAA